MRPMYYSLKYFAFGMLSNTALKLYFRAPREMMQDEFELLHRWAMKKAHTARMKGEAITRGQNARY